MKKGKVYTYKNSNVQLMASWLPVSFQVSCQQTCSCRRIRFQRFYRPISLLFRSNVSSCSLLPLRVGRPLFTDGSIVPRATGVHFLLARFVSPPLSWMKQVPFESTGIRLQNTQKLSVYTGYLPRYTLWYVDKKLRLTHAYAIDKIHKKLCALVLHLYVSLILYD